MNKSRTFSLVAILLFSLLAAANTASGNFTVDTYIDDAYYADLDGDGSEDDIHVDLTIYLDNSYIYTDIEVYVGITLPSGQEFWFYYSFTFEKYTYSEHIHMHLDLLNTALESGWYKADAVGFAEGEQFSYMDTLIFDPPGEKEGGEPAKGFVSFS